MSDTLNYWKLCQSLSLTEAALLIGGIDPCDHPQDLHAWEPKYQPRCYRPALQALSSAIKEGSLKGELKFDRNSDENGDGYEVLDPSRSMVVVEDLQRWLASKGVRTGFFSMDDVSRQPYLDPDNQRYAPKLAAAIAAWEGVGREPTAGKSVKQQLEAWARRHANAFGLCDDEGNPVKSAMETIATIANWETKGGAPKTPGEALDRAPNDGGELVLPQQGKRFTNTSVADGQTFDPDDEIPF